MSSRVRNSLEVNSICMEILLIQGILAYYITARENFQMEIVNKCIYLIIS